MSTTVMQKRFEDCYDGDVVHFIKIMISPLVRMSLWTDNISFMSEKGWIQKIYKQIQSCWLRESRDVSFFIPQIMWGIYCRRIWQWLTQTLLQKGSTVLRKRWRDMKNIFISRQRDLMSRQTIQLWGWNIAAGTTTGPSLHGIHQLSFRWRQG